MNDSIKADVLYFKTFLQIKTVIKNRLNLKSRNITRSLMRCIINNF